MKPRAGEQGKGFAVVAEEVGNLATMSGQAASEINLMIESSSGEIDKIFSEMQKGISQQLSQGRSKIDQGQEKVKYCMEKFDFVKNNIEKIKTVSSEIAVATSEQSRGIEEINKAISLIDSESQKNRHSAHTLLEVSKTFRDLSINLNNSIEQLKKVITG